MKSKISLIIPCYNEFSRLPKEEFTYFLDQFPEISIIFANDGSTDNTLYLLQKFKNKYPQVSVFDLKINSGKAEAVRQAIMDTKNENIDWIGYFDADLATPLEAVFDFIIKTEENPFLELVMGARVKLLGFDIKRDQKRHYFGRIFATLASFILKIPVYDTQCGAKLIRHKTALEIFSEKFISSWVFDVELIGRLLKLRGLERIEEYICEIPLKKWIEKGESKIRLFSVLKIPYQLLKIYRKYNE